LTFIAACLMKERYVRIFLKYIFLVFEQFL
jgi:hypothetical protein